MPSLASKTLRYVVVLAATVGLVGNLVFNWRFIENDGRLPFPLGIGFAIFATGWTVSKRSRS